MNETLSDCDVANVTLKLHSEIKIPMGCQISSFASIVLGVGSVPICFNVTLICIVSPLVMYSSSVESGCVQILGDSEELPISIPVIAKSTGLFLSPTCDFSITGSEDRVCALERLIAITKKQSKRARTDLIDIEMRNSPV